MDWRNYFPEAAPRPIQVEVLDFVIQNIEHTDAFFLELPPGVGKSAIAVTLAGWWNGWLTGQLDMRSMTQSYITTTTIALENQYMDSYRRYLKQLHSASHYICHRRGKGNSLMTCEQGRVVCNTTKSPCPGGLCPYKVAKAEFEEAPFGILNAAYLITENQFVGKMKMRGLLISDEGHTLPDSLCSFLQFDISPKSANSAGLAFPRISEGPDEIEHFARWIERDYIPAMRTKYASLKTEIEKRSGNPNDPLVAQFSHDLSKTGSALARAKAICNRIDAVNWVLERVEGRDESISLTPLSARPFAQSILAGIAAKYIILSATIIDFEHHTQELGLDAERVKIFRADSPFSVKNRPIFTAPWVKLDHKNVESSCTAAAQVLAPIIDSHKGERGIIFTSSYAQARGIVEATNKLLLNPRLQTHNTSKEKALLMQLHERRYDSVLVSPSLHEGLDLRDDLSRFQILLKLPFPSLGSKLVQRKKDFTPSWYPYAAVLKIIQATGRSVRSETDHADSYIFDIDWEWFYPRYQSLFPAWWRDAVQSV